VADIFGCLHSTFRHVFRGSHRSRLNRANGNGKRENYRKERFHSTNDSFLTARMRLPDGVAVAAFIFRFAPKRISKMAPSELPTRSALQIFLECVRFPLGFECNSSFNSPWPVLRRVGTIAMIVLGQALFKITRDTGVVNRLILLAHQNVNINEVFHLAGLPSRSLWSATKEVKRTPPAFTLLRRGSLRFFAALQSEGWARQDSNLGPRDYESPALTAELQAHFNR
jgi:hypothetical protein